MARGWKFVLAVQLSRDIENAKIKTVLSDLEIGKYRTDADIVMFLHRNSQRKAKIQHGKQGQNRMTKQA